MLIERGALGGQFSCQHRNGKCRRDAVFVWGVTWINCVAEGLFVAENQVRHLGDPLEAGEGLLELEAVFGGDCGKCRARNNRTRDCAFSAGASGCGGCGVTQDEPNFVAG